MATKKKPTQRSIWASRIQKCFTFIPNSNVLPTYIICEEQIAITRSRMLWNETWVICCNIGDKESSGRTSEIFFKNQQVHGCSPQVSLTLANSIPSQEIAKWRKPFTDSEYVKSCFINIPKELFADFKNKSTILNKFETISLSAKTVIDVLKRNWPTYN